MEVNQQDLIVFLSLFFLSHHLAFTSNILKKVYKKFRTSMTFILCITFIWLRMLARYYFMCVYSWSLDIHIDLSYFGHFITPIIQNYWEGSFFIFLVMSFRSYWFQMDSANELIDETVYIRVLVVLHLWISSDKLHHAMVWTISL